MALPTRDPRIYLAAERTFLAWIRTGLALMGFGFVVARFGLFLQEVSAIAREAPARSSGFSLAMGTGIVLAGVVVNAVAAWQHLKTIRNLNAGQEITGRPSGVAIALSLVLAAAGLTMCAYLIWYR